MKHLPMWGNRSSVPPFWCIHICMYIHVYIGTSSNIYKYVYKYTHVQIYICLRLRFVFLYYTCRKSLYHNARRDTYAVATSAATRPSASDSEGGGSMGVCGMCSQRPSAQSLRKQHGCQGRPVASADSKPMPCSKPQENGRRRHQGIEAPASLVSPEARWRALRGPRGKIHSTELSSKLPCSDLEAEESDEESSEDSASPSGDLSSSACSLVAEDEGIEIRRPVRSRWSEDWLEAPQESEHTSRNMELVSAPSARTASSSGCELLAQRCIAERHTRRVSAEDSSLASEYRTEVGSGWARLRSPSPAGTSRQSPKSARRARSKRSRSATLGNFRRSEYVETVRNSDGASRSGGNVHIALRHPMNLL